MDALNRETLEARRSVARVEHPDPPWLEVARGSANETLLLSVPRKYLKLTGDVLSELTQPEKDVVDVAELEAQRDAAAEQLTLTEDILRAFMLLVLEEFNLLRSPAYGGLYADSLAPVQVIPNATITALDALIGASAMSSEGMTVDTVNGRLVLPAAGDYMLAWQLAFSGSANSTWDVSLYGGASTEVDGTRSTRKLGAGGDVGSISGTALVSTPVDDVPINMRVRHSEGSDQDIAAHAFQLMAFAVPSAMQRTEAQLRNAIRNKLGS